jgi:RNA polymerase sigma-70 factor (ECF subfamily)
MSAVESVSQPARQQEVHALYSDHHGWLLGWLRRKLDNTCDAADIAQDTFMRVLARQAPLHLQEPRAYLSTIARGLVVDHWRRRELERAWLETLAALPESEAPSPQARMMFLETLIEIDRLLDSLKPQVRTAFLLAQLDGLTCPQIARHVGVSLATVERYIAKALRACYALRFEP